MLQSLKATPSGLILRRAWHAFATLRTSALRCWCVLAHAAAPPFAATCRRPSALAQPSTFAPLAQAALMYTCHASQATLRSYLHLPSSGSRHSPRSPHGGMVADDCFCFCRSFLAPSFKAPCQELGKIVCRGHNNRFNLAFCW